jgi:hypothetical protein
MNRIPYLASEHGPSPKQKEEKFEIHVQGYLWKGGLCMNIDEPLSGLIRKGSRALRIVVFNSILETY